MIDADADEATAAPATGRASRWVCDLIEQFDQATVTATQNSQGMEVRVAPAVCGLEQRLSIWQHPPTAGAAVVQRSTSSATPPASSAAAARASSSHGSTIRAARAFTRRCLDCGDTGCPADHRRRPAPG